MPDFIGWLACGDYIDDRIIQAQTHTATNRRKKIRLIKILIGKMRLGDQRARTIPITNRIIFNLNIIMINMHAHFAQKLLCSCFMFHLIWYIWNWIVETECRRVICVLFVSNKVKICIKLPLNFGCCVFFFRFPFFLLVHNVLESKLAQQKKYERIKAAEQISKFVFGVIETFENVLPLSK